MPWLNLFGWYVTGIALMAALVALGAHRWIRELPVGWLAGFYLVNLLLPMGMNVAAGLWGAVAATPAGQLLRPVVAFALAGGGEGEEVPAGEAFWSAALAVQMAHEASLLHDDIIDGASTRRGEPTLAAAGGVARALVQGDHLLTAAYRLAAGTGSLAFATRFAHAVERTVAGEMAQGRAMGERLGMARYCEIATAKSGELLGCALATAPTLAGRAEAAEAYELGRRLGLVYQMLDDLLDYCPAAETGKPPLADYAQRRWTWVLAELPALEFGRDAGEVLALLHTRPPARGSRPWRAAWGGWKPRRRRCSPTCAPRSGRTPCWSRCSTTGWRARARGGPRGGRPRARWQRPLRDARADPRASTGAGGAVGVLRAEQPLLPLRLPPLPRPGAGADRPGVRLLPGDRRPGGPAGRRGGGGAGAGARGVAPPLARGVPGRADRAPLPGHVPWGRWRSAGSPSPTPPSWSRGCGWTCAASATRRSPSCASTPTGSPPSSASG
jgi:hypothetical protein